MAETSLAVHERNAIEPGAHEAFDELVDLALQTVAGRRHASTGRLTPCGVRGAPRMA